MDSASHLEIFEDRLWIKFEHILDNARSKLREYIDKKSKVDIISEDSRSADTKEKIEELEELKLRVDVYLDEIFRDFIREVAVQHYAMLCNR